MRWKRMAEKFLLGPRSLRRNYPHQVQGVRPGRLSRFGSPALGATLKEEGGRRKWKVRRIEDGKWSEELRRRYPLFSILYPRCRDPQVAPDYFFAAASC